MEDGAREFSTIDRVVYSTSRSSSSSSTEHQRDLKRAIDRFCSWVNDNEFYLSPKAYNSGSELVLTGIRLLQAVEKRNAAAAEDARRLWTKRSQAFRRQLRRDARQSELE
jgi:hypothetical protein